MGDLALRIPTERVRSTARTCKLRFYIENKPQKLFDFRSALPYGYPSPEVSCTNFFLLLKLYYFTKANFRSAAPAFNTCINPTNRMRGHDEAIRREASVQRSRPEVGRSIYIYIYHDSGDVDLLTEASLRLGPITFVGGFVGVFVLIFVCTAT